MTRAKGPRAQPHKFTLSELKRAHELWRKATDDDWYAAIAELSRERGGDARIKPPHVVITCPWHDDTQPSCHVTPSRGLVKCFSCGALAVEPVRLVTALRGKGVLDAATWLRKRLGLKRILTTQMAERLEADARQAEMRDVVVGFCCEQLGQAFKIVADHGGFVCKGGEWSIATEAEIPLTNAQLYWCRSALEWLVTRFGADDGTSEPLWPTACDHQLVGVLPPLATVQGHFGVDSDKFKFFSGYFDAQLSSGHQHVGSLVFPRHDENGHVSSVKLRSPGEDKLFQVVMPAGSEAWPGLYGLRHAQRSIGGTPSKFFNRAWLMEGETSALATIAEQIRRGTDESLGWILLGGSGGSTPTLEPLADLGIERVSIVHDHDDAGEDVAKQVIDKTRTPRLAIEVFEWPEWFEVGTDPRDAVKQVGYPAWSRYLLDPAQFVPLPRCLADRALKEVMTDRVPEGDAKRRGQIAEEWGKLATDPQEIVAFATMTATALGIDADLLRRAIERRDVRAAAQDHAELARHVLQDLCDGETEVVHTLGSFWRYEKERSRLSSDANEAQCMLWCKMDEDAMARAIMDMCKGALKLKASDVRGVRELAVAQASKPQFFDDAPSGIMFRNGFLVVDDSGNASLLSPSPEHRARVALPIDYDPAAKAQRFERFLFECLRETFCTRLDSCEEAPLTCGQEHKHGLCWPRDCRDPPTEGWRDEWNATQPTIQLLEEFIGASLLGVATRYAKAIILEGSGENGKSVLLDIVAALFPAETWAAVEPQAWEHEYNRHALIGARINLVSELPSREVMSSAHVKQIITGDPTRARNPYKAVVNFRPVAGHLFLANELPTVADSSHGYWRRQIVIRWPHRFEGQAAEQGLARRIIREELTGVAAWAIAGGARLIKRGRYLIPEASREAVAEWRRDSDPVATWLDEATRDPEKDEMGESLHDLYVTYDWWSRDRGFARLSENTFAKRLKACGVRKHNDGKKRTWSRRIRALRAVPGMEEVSACQ